MGTYNYSVVRMDEDFFEQAIIERLRDVHGYEHLYGPGVPRSSGAYRDVFLPGVLEESLRRVNPGLRVLRHRVRGPQVGRRRGRLARAAQRGLLGLPAVRR